MKTYQSQTVLVDAVQWNGKNTTDLLALAGNFLKPIERRIDYKPKVETSRGLQEMEVNDWLTKADVTGELVIYKPDEFANQFKAA